MRISAEAGAQILKKKDSSAPNGHRSGGAEPNSWKTSFLNLETGLGAEVPEPEKGVEREGEGIPIHQEGKVRRK